MHEVSVVQNLLDHVELISRKHHLVNVTKVVVRIGERVCISPDSLRFAFVAVSPGTIAENAEFVIEFVPEMSRCQDCLAEYGPDNSQRSVCSSCGGPLAVIAGKELDLQTIEGDQKERANED